MSRVYFVDESSPFTIATITEVMEAERLRADLAVLRERAGLTRGDMGLGDEAVIEEREHER